MRGSITQRSKGSWRIRVDAGVGGADGKRRQHSTTVRGTRKKAESKLTSILKQLDDGHYIEPSKITVGSWVTDWLETVKARVRAATYTRYQGIIDNAITKAALGVIPIQKLRPSHLEAYYAAQRLNGLSGSTLALHHAVLYPALRKAVRDRLIAINPAIDCEGKPRRARDKGEDARRHAWTADEARQFLQTAKDAGPQPAAFYALALDTGMRKGELCGLKWSEVDFETRRVRVVRQLLSPTLNAACEPVFGPTKTGRPRTISLSPESLMLLKTHRKRQRELMMANRTNYRDLGLVFAKEWGDVRKREDVLGHPLQTNNMGQREYARLIKTAKVRPIKFHGLRHTCATLLLQAGTPVHVVSERLGHGKVTMTLEVYAHVLPDMQQDAAAKLGALLHG